MTRLPMDRPDELVWREEGCRLRVDFGQMGQVVGAAGVARWRRRMQWRVDHHQNPHLDLDVKPPSEP